MEPIFDYSGVHQSNKRSAMPERYMQMQVGSEIREFENKFILNCFNLHHFATMLLNQTTN